MKTAVETRNAELNRLTALLDGGYFRIYSGTPPASPESDATGELLASLRFGSPAFKLAADGRADTRPITEDSNAAATGKAGWFRCFKADGVTAIVDGTMGRKGDNPAPDIGMNSVAIQVNSAVGIDGFSITLPQ